MIYAFFGGKNETNLGIYIVLVCHGNAAYVYHRRRVHRNPSDCGKPFAFLSIIFLQVRGDLFCFVSGNMQF